MTIGQIGSFPPKDIFSPQKPMPQYLPPSFHEIVMINVTLKNLKFNDM